MGISSARLHAEFQKPDRQDGVGISLWKGLISQQIVIKPNSDEGRDKKVGYLINGQRVSQASVVLS